MLSGEGYKGVWSNGGMTVSRENVMMCSLIMAVYEYGTIDWCYAGESRRNS